MRANEPKRRDVLSLKRVQLKLVACVCLPLILSSLAVSVFQTYFFLSTLRSRGVLRTEYAQEIIPIAIWVTAIVLLVLISAGFMVTVVVGHRIVGPMGRFGRRLQDMTAGVIRTGFTFRDKDDLTFLAEAFAAFENRLHGDLAACQAQAMRLIEAAKKLRSYGVSGEAAEAAGEIEAAARTLAERINAYDLGLNAEPSPKDA